MLVRAPTVTGRRSPRSTLPYQIETSHDRRAREDQRALADRRQQRQIPIDDRAREAPPQLRDPRIQRGGVRQRTIDDVDRRRDRRHRAPRSPTR
jgi:hypothetical protein